MEFSGSSHVERKQRIDDLVEQLSSWELVHLRRQLRQRVIRLKSLQDLPSELICIIAIDNLDARHALRLTRVCRAWRAAVQQADVGRSLCRAHFPGLLEMSKYEAGDEFSVFLNAYMHLRRKYQRKTSNLFSLRRWFVEGKQRAFEERQVNTVYSSGKTAWQPSESFFIFQDLKKAHPPRQVHLTSAVVSGRKLDLLAMSDHLVVLTSIDATRPNLPCRQLKIWCIESSEFKSISLPAPLARCYPSGLHLYLTTLTGQVFIWIWDRGLTEIIASKEGLAAQPDKHSACLQGVPGVMPHPLDPNIVHLAWLYVSNPPGTKIEGPPSSMIKEVNNDLYSSDGGSYQYGRSVSSSTETESSGSESEPSSFHSSAVGSDHGGNSQSLPTELDGRDTDSSIAFTRRTWRRKAELEKRPPLKRLKVVVVKYSHGIAVERIEYDMAELGESRVASTGARYQKLDLYFQMMCDPLDCYGSFLVGVTCCSVHNVRRAIGHDSWGGIRFNLFSGKFENLEYAPARGRGFTRQYYCMGARFAAQDLSLVVVGRPRFRFRYGTSGKTIVLYALNAARKLGLLDHKKKSAVDMDREPQAILSMAKDIAFNREDIRIFMDSVGSLLPTEDFLLFSYNGWGQNQGENGEEGVTAKVTKTTVPHAWRAAQRRRNEEERARNQQRSRRLSSPPSSGSAEDNPWAAWPVVRKVDEMPRREARLTVDRSGANDDNVIKHSDDERVKGEAVEVVTDCWHVPYTQLWRDFCSSYREGDDYGDTCDAFRWREAQSLEEPPEPPQLELAEVEIQTFAPWQAKSDEMRWLTWREGASRFEG